MIEEKLHKLGLGKNEVKVYLALIELGKSKAGAIIDYSSLHRNLVYQSLEILLSKELVTKIEKNGVAIFSANSPDHLVKQAENALALAKDVAKEIKEKGQAESKEVTVYEGVEGIKRAIVDMLDAPEGETFYLLGASKYSTGFPHGSTVFDWTAFHARRAKKNIRFRALYDSSVDPEQIRLRNKMPLAEAKYLPFNLEMPVWFDICYDSVAIMVPDGLVFNIRNKPTADAMRKYFDFLWNQK